MGFGDFLGSIGGGIGRAIEEAALLSDRLRLQKQFGPSAEAQLRQQFENQDMINKLRQAQLQDYEARTAQRNAAANDPLNQKRRELEFADISEKMRQIANAPQTEARKREQEEIAAAYKAASERRAEGRDERSVQASERQAKAAERQAERDIKADLAQQERDRKENARMFSAILRSESAVKDEFGERVSPEQAFISAYQKANVAGIPTPPEADAKFQTLQAAAKAEAQRHLLSRNVINQPGPTEQPQQQGPDPEQMQAAAGQVQAKIAAGDPEETLKAVDALIKQGTPPNEWQPNVVENYVRIKVGQGDLASLEQIPGLKDMIMQMVQQGRLQDLLNAPLGQQ